MRPLRLGCVSFLNTRPLIDGLERQPRLELFLDVPSRLLEGLRQERFDVALLPVIDYQRLDALQVVPSGGIGCDGPTLTVRIFSRVPFERITRLACDTDSHTSVALARILLAEQYGVRPDFVDLNERSTRLADARLLIGDKVVCEAPVGYEYQLDLGQAWKELTTLPFVFAVWITRAAVDLGPLPQLLRDARRTGLEKVDEIVRRFAVPRGWPAELARTYLTEYLHYEIGPNQLQAIVRFHALAGKHGIIGPPIQPLRLYEPPDEASKSG